MKIAIPSQDGIHITDPLRRATSFLVLTVEGGSITGEEIRHCTPNDVGAREEEMFRLIRDCACIIVHTIEERDCRILKSKGIECLRKTDTLVASAIQHYLEQDYLRESNYCCSP